MVLGLALVGAGCGSDDGDSSSSGGGGSEPDADTSAVIADAKANIERLTKPASLEGGDPVTAESGLEIGILICGEGSPVCAEIGEEAAEAAELLGWTPTVVDGGLTPQGYASGMQRLVDQEPDMILSIVAGDNAYPQALAEADEKDIVVASVFSGNNLPPYSPPVPNGSKINVEVDFHEQGVAVADYAIVHTEGDVQAAAQTFGISPASAIRVGGFEERLSECSGCELLEKEDVGVGQDLIGISRDLAQAQLARYPDGEVNIIMPPSDSFSPGTVSAIELAKRDDVNVVSMDCNPEALDNIRNGDVQIVCADTPLVWAGWAAIDALARYQPGDEERINLPWSLVTKENAPAAGEPTVTFDFRGHYKTLWGV